MSLELEKNIICESVRSIPAVSDGNLFITSILQLFSSKTVMFDVIYCFQEKYRNEGLNEEEGHSLESKDSIDDSCKHDRPCNTEDSTIFVEFLACL